MDISLNINAGVLGLALVLFASYCVARWYGRGE